MRLRIGMLAMTAMLLSACAGGSDPESAQPLPTDVPAEQPSPEPTATAVPATAVPTEVPTEVPTATAVPSPTAVPTTTPEPTPAPPDAFREDFDADPTAPWTWVNEDSTRWRITADGRLELIAADPPLAAETDQLEQVNLLTRPIPRGVDIAVTTRVSAELDENFEQVALVLIEDGHSFVLVNFGYCSFCVGKGAYLETRVDGEPLLQGIQAVMFDDEVTDVWLRLEYSPEGNAIVALAAVEADDWQMVGEIVRNPPDVTLVGIGAANLPGPDSDPDADLVATFDFIELETFD